MTLTLLIIASAAAVFFAGVFLGYRTGITDGRQLARFQRHHGWVEDLETALAETSETTTERRAGKRTARRSTRQVRTD